MATIATSAIRDELHLHGFYDIACLFLFLFMLSDPKPVFDFDFVIEII